GLLDRREGGAGIDQCAEEHVTGGARGAVQPPDHRPASAAGSARRTRRATRAANTPAPKPWSMLHTTTPGAHEMSMVSSAAKPRRDAPYPTLVGTATTGTPTSPPTALGSAPSIPATTTRQSAASSWSRTDSNRWMPATPTSVTLVTPPPIAPPLHAAS